MSGPLRHHMILGPAPFKLLYTNTGADQHFVVPGGVSLVEVKLWGAGAAGEQHSGYDAGGAGGFTTGMLPATPGETLTVIVGSGSPAVYGAGAQYGGGGAAGGTAAGAGGGRSAIQRSGADICTAGGGGGAGGTGGYGGAGGGSSGTAGGNGAYTGGGPGTQVAGGAGGTGPSNGAAGAQYTGGTGGGDDGGPGGGGGYYGGGGGPGTTGAICPGGGGGSGYLGTLISSGGVTAATTAGSGYTPAGTSDPDYVSGIAIGGYGSGVLQAGGNGYVVISFGM